MRNNYDFSKAKPNPYAKRLKKQVTIRLDRQTIGYFKTLAEERASRTRHLPACISETALPGARGWRFSGSPRRRLPIPGAVQADRAVRRAQ